jgi:histidinol-phosphate aminotransferase
VSGYVTDIGGLGSYPTMVINTPNLPALIDITAHEWTHNYLYTFPTNIAWGYQTLPRLTTINETTATLVGKEISRKVIRRYYPDWADRLPPVDEAGIPSPHEPSEFDLAMRRIRTQVDQLLAEGKINQAEAYMEEERLKLVEKGYHLRKLNQAYFAFHGSYAFGPESVDPIGPQLRKLRAASTSLKDFLGVSTLPYSVHGARDYDELARLDVDPDDVLDFSSNCNPYGPHPTVLEAVGTAVTAETLNRYPDRDCLALIKTISDSEGVPKDCILPTSGASELIQLIAMAFVAPGSCHMVLAPTYGEYGRAIQLGGGQVKAYRATGANLRFDLDPVITSIRSLQPAGIWLCNPNNPTGQLWGREELDDLRRRADPEKRALWVVDESYLNFFKDDSPGGGVDFQASENVIIIRSLTKDYGLAGLRLGYGLAAPGLVRILRAVQAPWSVSSLAQVAGIAALQPGVVAWRVESLALLHRHARLLREKLAAGGFLVLPSSTPYFLVEVANASRVRRALLREKLLVRDCSSFGLPTHIRVATQLPEENERLIEGMQRLEDR